MIDEYTTPAAAVSHLRAQWATVYGSQPPVDLGRDLLARGINNRVQEINLPCPTHLRRELTRLATQLDKSGDLDLERQPAIKIGTRLIREWRGRTYVVTKTETGYLFEGHEYASLTKIAVAITGVNWSGPKFFGLRQRRSNAGG